MNAPPHRPKIRILYIIFGLGMGGAETVLFELANGLDRKEFEPIVLSLSPPAALSRKFADAGIAVHYLTMQRLLQAPMTLVSAIRTAQRLEPDILQGVLFHGDLAARLIRLALGKPQVVSALHNVILGKKYVDLVMRYTDSLTDAVTAVSHAVAETHVAAGIVRREKTTVIVNGIEPLRFARPPEADLTRLRERFGIKASTRVLLCIARLGPAKNHALLLRVFAKLSKRVPDVCLLLAGGGRLEPRLRAQAEQLGVTAQVIFAGVIDDVPPLFHLAEIFVLSSTYEGLPMVLLEAMASGVPVVSTSVGGIPEVITNGESGLLVPSGDEVALENALSGLLEGPETERRRLGDRGKAEVVANYGTARLVERTAALYRSLATSPRA